MRELEKDDRLRLLRFVCSFAWTDLKITDEEREFVRRLVARSELDPEERARVDEWLRTPPDPEDVDPAEVPHAHRELFVRMARQVCAVDGRIVPGERDTLAIFEELLR